jgi:hypothetical protein
MCTCSQSWRDWLALKAEAFARFFGLLGFSPFDNLHAVAMCDGGLQSALLSHRACCCPKQSDAVARAELSPDDRPFMFAVANALPEAVVDPADLVLSTNGT